MRRIVLAVLVLMFVAAPLLPATAGTAHASEWWCWDDPVLQIDGQVVRVLAGVPDRFKQRVTLAEVVIMVPNGVDARLTAVNAPHFPQAATLRREGYAVPGSPITVTATLTMHGHGLFESGLKIIHPSGATTVAFGQSNQQVTATLTLVPRSQTAKAK